MKSAWEEVPQLKSPWVVMIYLDDISDTHDHDDDQARGSMYIVMVLMTDLTLKTNKGGIL